MTTHLQSLSNELAALVQTAGQHVVRVEARRRLASSGVALGGGLIAATHHGVQKERDIVIGLDDGQTATAELIGRDPAVDLAILKTEATLPKFPLAADVGAVGHLALALGRPGRAVQATLGIISALGDEWRTALGGVIDRYVQTDVVMYPGFSGGPLVNAAGEMIGLNTSALLRGVSLTIPAATVARLAETIARHGRVKRGYLGVSTQPVRLPAPLAEQLGRETGLLLIGVEPGSPAEQAGLVLGDTIVAFDNRPIRDHDDLLAQLSGDHVGVKAAVTILRGGQLQSRDVTPGERS